MTSSSREGRPFPAGDQPPLTPPLRPIDVRQARELKSSLHPLEVMLFLNFCNEYVDSFKSKYHEVDVSFRGNDILFLIGDVDASQSSFQYFGLKEDQAPLIIIQEQDAKKYLKEKLEPEQITTWVKVYTQSCTIDVPHTET